MRLGSIAIAALCGARLLAACTSASSEGVSSYDAGTPPASASAECDPGAAHDASAFRYTATCAFAETDAGLPVSCQEWSESEDGDWTPFIAICLDAGGAITTVPCTQKTVSGACALAPGCTDQTTVFYYGDAAVAAGQATCASSSGASFTLTPPP